MRAARMLIRGRRLAESLMISSGIVTRANPDAEPVIDEETGNYEQPRTTVYAGKLKVSFPVGAVRDVDAQSQFLIEQGTRVDLPIVGSEGVRPGDRVQVTAHPLDSGRVGTLLTLTGDFEQSYATARRFPAELVSEDR